MNDRPGRRAWRSRAGVASVVPVVAAQRASSPTSHQDEVDVMETRPFLASASSSSSANKPSTFGSTVPGRIVSKATFNRLYQGVMSQTLGSTSTAVKKKKRDSSHLLHHHHHKNNTDAIHVQVPKRLMYYTAAVFLVLPLMIFVWKEFHLHPTPPHDALTDKHHHNPHHQNLHDQFPTWMDQEEHNGIAPRKGNLKGSAAAETVAAPGHGENTSSSSDKATLLEEDRENENSMVDTSSGIDQTKQGENMSASEKEGGTRDESGQFQRENGFDQSLPASKENDATSESTSTTTKQPVEVPERNVAGDGRHGSENLLDEAEEGTSTANNSDPDGQRDASESDDSGAEESEGSGEQDKSML